jgi:hypothetical protein
VFYLLEESLSFLLTTRDRDSWNVCGGTGRPVEKIFWHKTRANNIRKCSPGLCRGDEKMVSENDIEQFAKEIGRIEDGVECRCCYERFTPIDKEDFFCKKCLKKLHKELLEKMCEMITDMEEDWWKLKDMKKTVLQYKDIQKPKTRVKCP